MRTCEIRHMKHENSFRWKWQHVAPDGGITESAKTYSLYYECVTAARKSGFEPRLGITSAWVTAVKAPSVGATS